MGFPMDAIIEMGTKISPILDSELKLIALCITPYNIFKRRYYININIFIIQGS